jgi:hypothetical protein
VNELLAEIITSHGGIGRWNGYGKVEASTVSGGGARVQEIEPWREGPEKWRVLRAYFPGSIETHSVVQDFFFGDDLKLRRHGYNVNIAGGFAASQLTSEYVEVNGIHLPTKRRAGTRGPNRQPILDMLMVSIDIGHICFT